MSAALPKAHGLEQPITGPGRSFSNDDQRLVDQRSEEIEDGRRVDPIAGGDLLGGFECPSSGEHRQSSQQQTFVFVEQAEGPLEGRLESAMVRDDIGACRPECSE
jgi:hypothetical protein